MQIKDSERLKGICEKVADSCMGMRVRRVARVVGNHYDEFLKPTGLKGTQFTLLNAMYLNPTATISQIADFLLVDRTTLNRNLKPLEREGFVTSGHGKDLRTRTLKLTEKGVAALQRALPLWLEAQSGVVRLLGRRVERLGDDLKELEKLESA
jgi:DNA-binding MarR family transcriptional regulator